MEAFGKGSAGVSAECLREGLALFGGDLGFNAVSDVPSTNKGERSHASLKGKHGLELSWDEELKRGQETTGLLGIDRIYLEARGGSPSTGAVAGKDGGLVQVSAAQETRKTLQR